VPYYLLTLTVPAEMRGAFLHFPQELYPAFFAAVSGPLKALCARRKFLGGNIGFVAILHTIPPALKSEPPRCPFCNGLLAQIARIAPQRGPPLCQAILKAAA
jgi:hypothetical protein